MASSDTQGKPICHVLDFFYDEEDSCALTALISGVRIHIIVDVDRIRKLDQESLLTEYLLLLDDLRAANKEGDGADHGLPKSSIKSEPSEDAKDDADSAIDLSADRETRSKSRSVEAKKDPEDIEVELQNWILSFFADETRQLAPPQTQQKELTLHDWYNMTTYFFELIADKGELVPGRLKTTKDLQERVEALVPRMVMPKYIREMDVPWVAAKDILVQAEVAENGPVHPGLVCVDKETHFFKPVDPTQPQPTKREIKTLHQVERLGVCEKIRVPKLLGLVRYEDSSTEIMGMLLTNIHNPKPLTTFLTSEVPEEQRLDRADESKEVVQILHEQGIVWGDAKADNFVVDINNDLWIIDFGGSYTEGWIDPELSETKEGDNMAVEKIVNALVDPDENTFDPEDEDSNDSDYKPRSKKRKNESSEGLATKRSRNA